MSNDYTIGSKVKVEDNEGIILDAVRQERFFNGRKVSYYEYGVQFSGQFIWLTAKKLNRWN